MLITFMRGGTASIARIETVLTLPMFKRLFFNWERDPTEIKEQKYVLNKTMNAEPKEVFSVVSEVSKYQEFIPYCVESFVNERDPANNTPVEAGLRVGFRQYDEKFMCRVDCQDVTDKHMNIYSVSADSISLNLFHILSSKWIIKPHNQRLGASQVELTLKFKFKSKLYNSVSSIFARSVTELVMKAFDKRVFDLKKAQANISHTNQRRTVSNSSKDCL